MIKRANRKVLPVISILFLLLGWATASGGTIYVDANAAGANDGTNWADAYKYLQDGLADANQSSNDIWVAEGTYYPDASSTYPCGTNEREATFQLINGVAIYGGYAGYGEPDPDKRDIELYETILSGDINTPGDANDNSYHVVTGSGTDATAVVDGFTITAGNANSPGPYNNNGGGMYNVNGSPAVTNCTFSGNHAAILAGGGAGMYNELSSPTVTNCTFSENFARGNLGGGYGGGMYNFSSGPRVVNCIFSGNEADDGGGMANYGLTPRVVNCRFSGNEADNGGGIYNNDSDPALVNCTFSGNDANNYGGGVYNGPGSEPVLTSCTFSGNEAATNGGGIYSLASTLFVINCILWDNSDLGGNDESAQIDSTLSLVEYCCIQGLDTFAGSGNIADDPLFVDANGPDGITGTLDDNLRLSPDSNCIDAGDNNWVLPDILDLDNDGNTVEPIPWDLDGRDRVVDGDCNETDIVDMGAYEFDWAYIGDFAGGCDIDFVDFTYLALTWQKEDGEPGYDYLCDISIPADSFINVSDLKIFTDNWLAGK